MECEEDGFSTHLKPKTIKLSNDSEESDNDEKEYDEDFTVDYVSKLCSDLLPIEVHVCL